MTSDIDWQAPAPAAALSGLDCKKLLINVHCLFNDWKYKFISMSSSAADADQRMKWNQRVTLFVEG